MSAVYAIDGGIIKDYNIVKCDKLVLLDLDNQTLFELFVELKRRKHTTCDKTSRGNIEKSFV